MKAKIPLSIVGGGFSGLTLAHYLEKLDLFEISIYEKSNWGGQIQSQKFASQMAEAAAFSLLNNVEFESLAQELKIPLSRFLPTAKKKFFFIEKLTRWPLSFLDTLFLAYKLMLFVFVRNKVATLKGHTVQSWASCYFSASFADKVLSTALLGIYAAPAEELNAELVLSKYFKKRTSRPSLRGSVVPKDGLSHFLQALKDRLSSRGVQFFNRQLDHHQILKLKESSVLCFAGSFSQVRPTLLQISGDLVSFNSDASQNIFVEALQRVRMISLCKVHLKLTIEKKKMRPVGLGALFHLKSELHSIGVLFDLNIVANKTTIDDFEWYETWFLSDQKLSNLSRLSENELLQMVRADRSRVFSNDIPIDQYCVSRTEQSYPVYDANLKNFLNLLQPKTGVYFVGNYMGTLGLADILKRNSKLMSEIKNHYEK